MAKIIGKKPDKSAIKRVVCKDGCGFKIEYVPNDVKDKKVPDFSGTILVYYIICPNCSKHIEIIPF